MMAQIKLDRRYFPDITRKQGQSPITFKANSVTGYVPLLKIFNVLTGGNDYFKINEMGQHPHVSSGVSYYINFISTHNQFSFRRNMNRHTNFNNPRANIVICMLSILGIQGSLEAVQSKIGYKNGVRNYDRSRKSQNILLTNPVEVFVLAMIKPSDLVKIKITNSFIEFDSNIITLFVSKEKYHSRKYLNENYNRTVAKSLRQRIDRFISDFNVKVEIVPDEVLKQYYTNPYSVETNSIFEIIEIDKRIKNTVFSTLNKRLVIAE